MTKSVFTTDCTYQFIYTFCCWRYPQSPWPFILYTFYNWRYPHSPWLYYVLHYCQQYNDTTAIKMTGRNVVSIYLNCHKTCKMPLYAEYIWIISWLDKLVFWQTTGIWQSLGMFARFIIETPNCVSNG